MSYCAWKHFEKSAFQSRMNRRHEQGAIRTEGGSSPSISFVLEVPEALPQQIWNHVQHSPPFAFSQHKWNAFFEILIPRMQYKFISSHMWYNKILRWDYNLDVKKNPSCFGTSLVLIASPYFFQIIWNIREHLLYASWCRMCKKSCDADWIPTKLIVLYEQHILYEHCREQCEIT